MKKTLLISSLMCSLLFAESTHIKQNSNDLSLTVYNNIAMVNDKRNFSVEKTGKNKLIYEGIPQSVIFESIIPKFSKDTLLYSQNYMYDTLSQRKLLEKNINKEIEYKKYTSESDYTIQKGTLLSLNPILIKTDEGIVADIPSSRIVFKSIPKDLILKPSLVWNTKSIKGNQSIYLNYLTRNITWKSDYIVNIQKDNKLDLNGWITVTNNSGTSYDNANLYFVAGDINTQKPQRMYSKGLVQMDMAEASFARAPEVKQKSFAGNHLYKIPFKESIKNKQQKQINFINKKDISYKEKPTLISNIYNIHNSMQKEKYSKIIEFKNTKENKLGIPLPQGSVRSYQKDEDISHFIGQDNIGHTSTKETISLNLGKYFDIYSNVKVKKQINKNKYKRIAFERNIKNEGKETKTIYIKENIGYGNNVDLNHNCRKNCKLTKVNNRNYIYEIEIPSKSKFILKVDYEIFN